MRRNKITLILLIAITVSGLIATIPFAESYTGQKIAEYISSPLPTAPAAMLQGGDFPVSVKPLSGSLADGVASDWSGTITSIYGAYSVSLVNGSRLDDAWLLYFHVSEDVHVGLYNLTLTQGSVSAHQSRCVWVLDEWPESITFSQITDIHEPIGELVFPAFIMQSNFINPDFVIATGDIVQTESNARSWAYLQYAMFNLEYPSYLLPGNHDYSGYGGKGYAMYGGKLNYTLVLGNFVIIAADSAENGYFKASQISWIESQLQKYPDKVKVLGFHHAFLSSEYEDDLGSTTGGYIDADWENIDDLANTMYFTWKDAEGNPLPVSKELLRIIQENDVRLILNGHVHRDMIYVVNNQHYFVTTSTTGGGLPPESRFGSRLITLDNDGTVHLDSYAEANLDNPPNNIPTGMVAYTYRSANDFTGIAVSASVENLLDMDIDEGRLIFKVSNSRPIGDYVFVGEQPVRFETATTDLGYVFDAYFNVEAKSSFEVTLKAASDTSRPELYVALVAPYQPETPTQVMLTARDLGWGIKELDVSYSINGGQTWLPVDAAIEPILNGVLYKDTFPEVDVIFEVPGLLNGESILVKAEASDYAGNTASFQSSDLAIPEVTIYTLSVESTPIDVDVMVNEVLQSTPYEAEHASGTITLSAPQLVSEGGKEYGFKNWSTGSTSPETSVDLSADTSISVTYEEIIPSEPDESEETGGGIPLPASFMLIGVMAATFLLSQRKPRLS
ncbi:MAG: metallophosphoesterase [Candidatus Bathyarchaeota archaeon]